MYSQVASLRLLLSLQSHEIIRIWQEIIRNWQVVTWSLCIASIVLGEDDLKKVNLESLILPVFVRQKMIEV